MFGGLSSFRTAAHQNQTTQLRTLLHHARRGPLIYLELQIFDSLENLYIDLQIQGQLLQSHRGPDTMADTVHKASVTAPVNIAVIK